VLSGPLGHPVRRAVPLNLSVSLVTLAVAFVARGRTLSVASLSPLALPMSAIIVGAVVAALVGTALVGRLSNERLERTVVVLLSAIGCALIVEGFLPQALPALVPDATIWRLGAGFFFGLAVGLVSSLLGVAGGEVIIPTLVFVFGADIKTAGTASLLISLPTVLVGVVRYALAGAFVDRSVLKQTVVPMGAGSVVGAVAGGLLVGLFPAAALKIGLGVILIISAFRMFRHARAA